MKFIDRLRSKLLDGRAETSVNLYMSKLLKLNGGKQFNSLSFLVDTDNILSQIKGVKSNTQLSYLTSILVALEHYPKYKDAKSKYVARYDELVKQRKQVEATHQKSETEEESLIPIQELSDIRNQLRQKTDSCHNQEFLSKSEYNSYLQHLILELYTDIPPRRNQDYLYMYVVYDRPEVLDESKNYLIINERVFIFNKYKTSKVYGVQEFVIPDSLFSVIEDYLARHPSLNDTEFPFLVNYKGKELDKLGGITKILNKVFNKKVGCSALRHVFITDKFGDTVKEREEVANAMAHSSNTQNKYIKL